MKIVGVAHTTVLPEEEAKLLETPKITREVSFAKKFLEPKKIHGVEFPRWGNDAPIFLEAPNIAKKILNKNRFLARLYASLARYPFTPKGAMPE